jgi:tRNA nucleotidyltransferase (CCA-adding enzyme)
MNMKIYLVGGAVRDALLGLPMKERDWVVTGSTPAEMLNKGYRQVGKDFPVFLHPETNEEYALARLERKTGRGYTGFNFDASAAVTLEEDLLRRDLTINAIAQEADGKNYIDPFHGRADLDKKILRHVSPAFVEDPVRVLRIARFSARFADLGFTIAPETLDLMKAMVTSGEIDSLVAERVWKELERALAEKNPEEFFHVLENCGALNILFPAIKKNAIGLLQNIARLTDDVEIRFAALMYYLSPVQIKDLCAHYRAGSAYRDLALLVAQHYSAIVNANNLSAAELLNLFQTTDAFRRAERFQKGLSACATIAAACAQSFDPVRLLEIYQSVKKMDFASADYPELKGKEIGDFITIQRLAALEKLLQK